MRQNESSLAPCPVSYSFVHPLRSVQMVFSTYPGFFCCIRLPEPCKGMKNTKLVYAIPTIITGREEELIIREEWKVQKYLEQRKGGKCLGLGIKCACLGISGVCSHHQNSQRRVHSSHTQQHPQLRTAVFYLVLAPPVHPSLSCVLREDV